MPDAIHPWADSEDMVFGYCPKCQEDGGALADEGHGLCLGCDAKGEYADRHPIAERPPLGATLEVGIDPGADGAYGWELSWGAGTLLCSIASGVRSLGAEERFTAKGGVRRLTSADCFAAELDFLRRWVFYAFDTREPIGLRLVAYLEVPPAAPGQSSSTTASQHRSLGRIEGVLVALGFEVHLTRPPVWRAALGMAKVGDTLGTDDARAKQKLAKTASLALAKALRPDLEDRIGEDDNRAEAVLVMIAGRKLRLERESKERT